MYIASHPRLVLAFPTRHPVSQDCYSPKSFPVISFADPHPLNSLESYCSRNMGGGGYSRRSLSTDHRSQFTFPYPPSFHALVHSFALAQNSTLLFPMGSALFARNHRGWGGGHMFGRGKLAEITKDPPLQARRARYLRPRLDFMMISGQRAKIEVVRPPRGVNSPRTTHHSGRTASTISRRILLTAFS